MEPMERVNVVRVRDGQDRQGSMKARNEMLRRLKMKHISPHPEGYQVRVSCNGKMHSAWEAFRHFKSEDDCLAATVRKRNDILEKLKKPLSPDPVIMASPAFPGSKSRSNTGHRGLYYREYSYYKRGIKQFVKVVDVRWWNKDLGEFGHTTVACKKHGGRANAVKVAKEIQEKMEARHGMKRGMTYE